MPQIPSLASWQSSFILQTDKTTTPSHGRFRKRETGFGNWITHFHWSFCPVVPVQVWSNLSRNSGHIDYCSGSWYWLLEFSDNYVVFEFWNHILQFVKWRIEKCKRIRNTDYSYANSPLNNCTFQSTQAGKTQDPKKSKSQISTIFTKNKSFCYLPQHKNPSHATPRFTRNLPILFESAIQKAYKTITIW